MGGDKGDKMANAMAVVAGRGWRPCDVCARKRARLYCAADEAYLCDSCDSSVHAANALAFRHERVRLTPHGSPMKMGRRSNLNLGDHSSSPSKKKLKTLRPAPNSGGSKSGSTAFPSFQPQEKYFGEQQDNALREVKVELNQPNWVADDIAPDASDDHFTAEELTGNANLLDDTPSGCPPSFDDASNPDYGNHGVPNGDSDFAHDFLVSDPSDANNCGGGNHNVHGSATAKVPTSSDGGEDAVDEGEDDDEEEGLENHWMNVDFVNQGFRAHYVNCMEYEPEGSLSAGASDQSAAVYSYDEKPAQLEGGVPPASSQMGKAFKNIAGQSEWVKTEDGYPNHYGIVPKHDLGNTSCKIEGLSESGLRHVPSLRLDYADVLSSWPDRGCRWTDDGSGGSQLVPGDDSTSDMGSCYDLGLVPDLSNGGCGVDGGSGHFAHMYGGCGPGGAGGLGAGDDTGTNAYIAREVRVNRYREKRRTRLFSKKIRYEVRKLNAEKRPRMKGRFVKRSPGCDT